MPLALDHCGKGAGGSLDRRTELGRRHSVTEQGADSARAGQRSPEEHPGEPPGAPRHQSNPAAGTAAVTIIPETGRRRDTGLWELSSQTGRERANHPASANTPRWLIDGWKAGPSGPNKASPFGFDTALAHHQSSVPAAQAPEGPRREPWRASLGNLSRWVMRTKTCW